MKKNNILLGKKASKTIFEIVLKNIFYLTIC
jgi:hypothetical protein